VKDLRELLPDYALGLLEGEERRLVEGQLEADPALRRELAALEAALYRLPETLPPVLPPPGGFAKVQRRTSSPRLWGRIVAAAAVLALLGLGSFSFNLYAQNRVLAQEQAKVASWLADPKAEWKLIKDAQGQAFGTMLWLPDGRCLMVLSEPPPPGKVYQAWGRRSEETPVSLGTFGGRVFETHYKEFQFVGVSLEPPGGSPQPTHPLGRVPVL
jgi:anti-sigma-K factor RskA